MDHVILYRNSGNGKIGFVSESEEIAVFDSWEAALSAVADVPVLRAFPYQIVEINEI